MSSNGSVPISTAPKPGDKFRCPKTGDEFRLGSQIGTGGDAIVYECVNLSRKMDTLAVKIIDLRALRMSGMYEQKVALINREVSVMQQLRHPGIVQLYTAVQTDVVFYLVMELVTLGELFYKIVDSGAMSEDPAKYVFTQLLHTMKYLHSKGVVHRDLKPENILIKEEVTTGYFIVKLADFGLSKILCGGANTFVGTPQYFAPEILNARKYGGAYGTQVDMWALGIVLYVMLGGAYPFRTEGSDLERRVVAGEFNFHNQRFRDVSDDAKNMIRCLLTVNPDERLSVSGCLTHPWIVLPISTSAPPLPPIDAPYDQSDVGSNDVLLSSLLPVLPDTITNYTKLRTVQLEDQDVLSPSDEFAIEKAVGRNQGCAGGAAAAVFNSEEFANLEFGVCQRVNMAYLAFRHHPEAARLLRNFLSDCRELHYRAVHIINKFQSTSVAVLSLLPDLSLGIREKESSAAIYLLQELQLWVQDMKTDCDDIRTFCRSFTKKLQTIMDVARVAKHEVDHEIASVSQMALECSNSSGNSNDRPVSFGVKVEEVREQSDLASRTETIPFFMVPPVQDDKSSITAPHRECYDAVRDSLLNHIKTVLTYAWDEVEGQTISPHNTFAGLPTDDVLTNLKPSVMNQENLARELLDFLLMSPRCRLFASKLLDQSAVDEGPRNGWWSNRLPQRMKKRRSKVSSEGAHSDIDIKEHPEIYGMDDASSTDSYESASPEIPIASFGKKSRGPPLLSSYLQTDAFFNHLAASSPEDAAKSILEGNLDAPKLLSSAMMDLAQVEEILCRLGAFWSNMAITLEQLFRMKGYTYRLFDISCHNDAFRERFLRRILDYQQFWNTLHKLCVHYTKTSERKWRVFQALSQNLQFVADHLDTMACMNYPSCTTKMISM